MKELDEHVRNNNYKNIYLFFGEPYFKKYYEKKFKEAILSHVTNDINFNVFNEKFAISNLIDTAQTAPLFAKYRFIIGKNTGLFSSNIKENMSFLENLPPTTIIVFIEKDVDKRLKLFKTVKKIGYIAEFKIPTENELIKWVTSIFKKEGKTITNPICTYFLRNTILDMNLLLNEIKKLTYYCKEKEEITVEDIDDICTISLNTKIFNLLNFVGLKNTRKALEIYNNMIQTRSEPLMILTMLYRQFKLILRTKALMQKNIGINEISSSLGVQSFAIKDYVAQSKNFKYSKLISIMENCLETDISIKTGKINSVLAVEMLIVTTSS